MKIYRTGAKHAPKMSHEFTWEGLLARLDRKADYRRVTLRLLEVITIKRDTFSLVVLKRVVGLLAMGANSTAMIFDPSSRVAGTDAPVYPAQPTQAAAPPSKTGSIPDGKVSFSGGQIAAGIGYSWGHGTLTYHGEHHLFRVSGFSVAHVGASSITAAGDVYNLERLEDFPGNYASLSAGITVGGGGSVAYLRNQNGVVIKVNSTSEGLDFQLAANGIHIAFE